MGKSDHYHLYRRVNLATTPGKTHYVYRCMEPNCSHYLTKEMVVGKVGRCPRCKEPFVITKALLHKKANPHCSNCFERRKNVEHTKKINVESIADAMLARLGQKD